MSINKHLIYLWVASATAIFLGGCASSGTTVGSNNQKKKPKTPTEIARMYIEIANGAINEGDPTGALENLFRAEREDPLLPELYHSEAIAFFMKHDLPTALLKARKAVELKPDYADANNTLGKLLIDSGKSGEAIAPLRSAADNPVYREAFKAMTNLGIIYYRRGDYGQAEGYLSHAITDAPQVACVAYYYRGHIRLRESRFKDAVADYDNAGKRSCAGFADAHLAMGLAYERGKQYAAARKVYLEVESRFPNSKFSEQAMNHLRSLP